MPTDAVKSLKHLRANQPTDKDRLENARNNNYDFANEYVLRKINLNPSELTLSTPESENRRRRTTISRSPNKQMSSNIVRTSNNNLQVSFKFLKEIKEERNPLYLNSKEQFVSVLN